MAKLNDLEDVSISNPKVGDVVKYTATGWQNAADATSTPVGGNPCGDLDGYTENDKEETITEPWTWEDAGCPSITVKDTNLNEKAEICADRFVISDGNGKTGLFKTQNQNGEIEIRVNGGRLQFRDDQVTPPVSLAELVAGASGGDKNVAFAPITLQFEVDEAASVKDNTYDWSLNADGKTATFSYTDWGVYYAADNPALPNRAFNVLTAVPRSVTMPPGANGAIVLMQNIVTMGVPGSPGLSALGSQRALAVSHRVGVQNATFPIHGYTGYGIAHKAIVDLPGNASSVIEHYRTTKSFLKADVINFPNNAVVTFSPRVDILKGGRGEFTTSAGRLIILPFYSDTPDAFNIPDVFSDDAGFYYTTEDDLNDIYDEITPPETLAEGANALGTEYRDLLRRIIVSLESRKAYPPAGGATEAEFNAQIQAAWALVDNSTLQTKEEFESALDVYYTEITKEKYGIAVLFQFELEAGNTSRGLL
jgi:hypothetical protein